MSEKQPGEVVTFYSYKGGVGRTMALANVAWLLASNGRRVLMIDWDLEAPGLHRYFYPFLDDPNFERTDGLVELLWEFVATVQTQPADRVESLVDPSMIADVSRIAVPIRFEFRKRGALHLIGAGRQDRGYADHLYKFEWQSFYERFGGTKFVNDFIATARANYDHVLVDSRTGVADTSGICTIQIPDKVILLFTYNRQSVEGTAAVGHALREARPDLPLLLRPMRVVRDVEGLSEARQFAHSMLGSFLPSFDEDETAAYWQRTEVPHYPAYAFEEALAALRDVAGGRNTLLSDMEVLTSDLAGGLPISPPKLERVLRERLLKQCRLRDPRQVALAEAMELEPLLAQRRLAELAAEARRRYHWDLAWISQIAEKSQEIASELSKLGRREEALAASLQAVEIRRQLALARPDDFLPDLASSLNGLSVDFTNLGRREEALAASQESVEIHRRLATTRPDAFQFALAQSLSNLSNNLSDLGRQEEALAPIREAVEIYQRLTAEQPEVFMPDLASTLNNLGNRLRSLGQLEPALAASQQAVAIRRQLATRRPDAFLPDLARSLNNLSPVLSQLGRREEALATIQEAVEIRSQLASVWPDAFSSDLAASLSNLANRLSDIGQHKEGLAASQKAVELLRQLAVKQPDAFRPELARSLHNLGEDLAANERLQEALEASQEAVDIRRQLAAALPDAFRPDLARSLHSLANRFAALGCAEAAAAAGEEAVEIRRQLAVRLPEAFLPDLAASLSNLGPYLLMVKRPAEALAASQEAVEANRKLAAARPEAFSSQLASSLCNLSHALAGIGNAAEAAKAAGEGLAIAVPLVEHHPQTFADLAGKLARASVTHCHAAGLEPDAGLLQRVARALEMTDA